MRCGGVRSADPRYKQSEMCRDCLSVEKVTCEECGELYSKLAIVQHQVRCIDG